VQEDILRLGQETVIYVRVILILMPKIELAIAVLILIIARLAALALNPAKEDRNVQRMTTQLTTETASKTNE
jgi:hypothetical protein